MANPFKDEQVLREMANQLDINLYLHVVASTACRSLGLLCLREQLICLFLGPLERFVCAHSSHDKIHLSDHQNQVVDGVSAVIIESLR